MVRHDQARQLQTPSLSTQDHCPCGVVVLPVSSEPAALAQAALSLQPLLSVVFTSGRSRICHGLCASVGVPFLAKPYRLTELLELVERALKATSTQ